MKRDSFKDFVLEQLRGFEAVECRPMFGGFGLYLRGTFFGILYKGRLYFKTGRDTQKRYIRQGMKPFRPSAKQTLKTYYEVPVSDLEDSEKLAELAEESVREAERKKK